MAGNIKNSFDFGTGSIDKDQWQRDIDSEQDAFITRYTNATNKKSGLLLRLAFQDLRKRIANGDMLNRTADGLYQFGSALNREDKHMQEAYQRALGFMGELARRLIQAPPAEPEKKKFDASTLEDAYKKSLFPGKFNEKAYWDRDETKRKQSLIEFLEGYTKEGALDSYQDFEDFGSSDKLKTRINQALEALRKGEEMDYNLGRLGFQGSWINKPVEEQLESLNKDELEQATLEYNEQQRADLAGVIRRLVEYGNHRGLVDYDLPEVQYNFDDAAKQYRSNKLDATKAYGRGPFSTGATIGAIPIVYNTSVNDYVNNQIKDFNLYFKDFGTKWQSIYELGDLLLLKMADYLTRLFSTYKTKDNKDAYTYSDIINKYFTNIDNDKYLLNNSIDKTTGRYTYYIPGKGLHTTNYRDTNNDYVRLLLEIQSLKEGGKIEFLQAGGGFNYNNWAYSTPTLESVTTQDNTESTQPREMSATDYASIIADIGSIAASFVPGYGTAASAILGVGSTISNFISDINDDNMSLKDALWNGAKGLGADAVGLIPGFGAGAKGWKIATRIAKFGTGLLAGLDTLGLALKSPEIMDSFKKVISLKVNDMSLLDWRNVLNGLSMLATAGRIGHGYAVHKGYKNLLKPTTLKPQEVKALPKTKVEKAKAKLGEFRDKFKGTGETYDYGGPNTLPWYHDANIYLWGANRTGFNPGFKNVYKVDMSTKLLKPKRKRTVTKKLQSKPKEEQPKQLLPSDRGLVWNESTRSYVRTKQIGGVLKALRNGGIIKADGGIKLPSLKGYATDADWANLNFGTNENHSYADNGFSNREAGGLGPSRGLYANGVNGDLYQDLNSARLAQYNYYTFNGGKNIFGDVLNYYNTWKTDNPDGNYQAFILDYNSKVDELRNLNKKKLNTTFNSSGWTYFNDLFHKLYLNYGKTYINKDGKEEVFDDWSDKLKDYFGESTARRVPNTFDDHEQFADLRNGLLNNKDLKSRVGIDNEGKLFMYDQSDDGITEVSEKQKDSSKITDSEREEKTIYNTNFKNPTDPTPFIIAGKTIQGLLGNRNIYKNLIDEMPQAALRDPINRQLAIVGWQEQIKQGQNQLADLRNATWMQHGSDLLVNLAGVHEVENKGRGIMDEKYMKDSERLFDTAQKLWNLKNEDILYNLGVGDANRRSIADRARMIAQIRAAWRSGDNNILMGALSDTGNWLMKKYQREQDVVNLAREQQLGTREQFLEDYVRNAHSNYDALKAELENSNTSPERKAQIKTQIQQWLLDALRKAPSAWALKIYSNFHTPGFGGGYKETVVPIGKDGSKLEVAKLKARSKDNDRYVSMIKDLRHTSYRRRRRR